MPMQGEPINRARSPAPNVGPDPNMRARSPAPDMRMRGNPAAQTRPFSQQVRQPPPQQQTQQRPPSQQAPPQAGGARNRAGIAFGQGARPTSSYSAHPSQQDPVAPSSYDQRGRGVDSAVRRERSKSMAAPTMSAHPMANIRSQSRQGSSSQYRAVSPNPYVQTQGQADPYARVNTAAQYTDHMGVQLTPAPGEVAMYEAPGNVDVSPSVCFMGK